MNDTTVKGGDEEIDYIPSSGFEDVYYSKIDENGNFVYKATDKHEGGYSDRENDLGKKTNYGVTQAALDEYHEWKSHLKKGKNFPIDVKDLKPIQAKQILDEMYYQRYQIIKIKNSIIARNVFDEEMSQGVNAGCDLALCVNEIKGRNLSLNKIISNELADLINSLSSTDVIKVNDLLTQRRMERYFNSVDNHPKNINNLQGWYNRVRWYYSDFQSFEKLYKDKVDYYIKQKYHKYYNGK